MKEPVKVVLVEMHGGAWRSWAEFPTRTLFRKRLKYVRGRYTHTIQRRYSREDARQTAINRIITELPKSRSYVIEER